MSKLLRTDLPDDVWERLNDEAAAHGMKIGLYVKRLIVARDAKRVSRASVSRNAGAKS
jgi:hypothetical protein